MAGGVLALRTKRQPAEQLAASAINWCALLYSREAEGPGARLEKILTLFTAAQWWGPGDSGWQQLDSTWTCTDKRNIVGQVVQKNGRLIWSIGDVNNPSPSQSHAVKTLG